MAILTLHHWSDVEAGLAEMVRVAHRRVVIVGFDRLLGRAMDRARLRAGALGAARTVASVLDRVLAALPPARVEPLLAPKNCTDRMFATLWARPEQYLDPHVHSDLRLGPATAGDLGAGARAASVVTSSPVRGTSGTATCAGRRSGMSGFRLIQAELSASRAATSEGQSL